MAEPSFFDKVRNTFFSAKSAPADAFKATPGVSTRSHDLWEIGKQHADNVGLFKRFRHSKFLDPFRRGAKQAVRTVAGKATDVAISLIPIPLVKDIVEAAVDKAKEALRGHYTGSTLSEIQATDTEGKVKWGWKDLDIEDMDRYRWKVHHGVKVLNDAFNKAAGNFSSSASICNDWVRPIAKYHYLNKRIYKLRERAEIIKALCEDTLKWTDDITSNPNYKNMESTLKQKVFEIDLIYDEPVHHMACDDTVCVKKDAMRFVDKHSAAVNGISTSLAYVVNDLTDLGMGQVGGGDD